MKFTTSRRAKAVGLFLMVSTVAACGLPRIGPNKSEIYSGSVQQDGNTFVIGVSDAVNQLSVIESRFGFPSSFLNASQLGPDTVQAGDTLALTFYENVDDGLLAGAGSSISNLSLVVDGAGYIFVPYAGRIRAAGNSPERLRQILTEKLSEQTPDPQVIVRRSAGSGATVTIAGVGIVPIEGATRTLLPLISSVGGAGGAEEITTISVQRGSSRGTIWYEDLLSNPANDIALRPNDKIFLDADDRFFTALGALGGGGLVPFETKTLSAMEAVSRLGGLSSATADPTGIFILRDEKDDIANRITGRTDLVGDQRFAYVLNLTEPNGLFLARDFLVRDGDTIYVTEAPFTQFTKVISSITGAAGAVDSLNAAAGSPL